MAMLVMGLIVVVKRNYEQCLDCVDCDNWINWISFVALIFLIILLCRVRKNWIFLKIRMGSGVGLVSQEQRTNFFGS